jgi:hypothetical protein
LGQPTELALHVECPVLNLKFSDRKKLIFNFVFGIPNTDLAQSFLTNSPKKFIGKTTLASQQPQVSFFDQW